MIPALIGLTIQVKPLTYLPVSQPKHGTVELLQPAKKLDSLFLNFYSMPWASTPQPSLEVLQ